MPAEPKSIWRIVIPSVLLLAGIYVFWIRPIHVPAPQPEIEFVGDTRTQ